MSTLRDLLDEDPSLRLTIERAPEPISNPATRERYLNDERFSHCVDTMMGMIRGGILTTQDIARAAVLAAQMYAEQCEAPMTVIIREGVR